MIRVSELKLPVTGNQKALEKKLAKALRVPVEEIKAYRISSVLWMPEKRITSIMLMW